VQARALEDVSQVFELIEENEDIRPETAEYFNSKFKK
jgi:hypothetical protein